MEARRRMMRNRVREDSSDSEGDADVQASARRWNATSGTAAAAAADEKAKKKKRRLAPQETIDKIWERFQQKRFSKAMAVLPFAPVDPSPLSHRANELLSLGYERAAEECRRKVNKIIKECRRVNMRYRDAGWDIDWDLMMGLGHCLNSLGRHTFNVGMKNMQRPNASVPKAVKRVHEIFEAPTFMKTVSGSDIKQGSLGDCWFISCVSGLANVQDGLQRVCVAYDTKIGIYGFVFYRDGEWIYSIIDDKLYLTSPSWDSPSFQRDLLSQIDQDDIERVYRKTYQTGSKALFFAQNKDQNETWLPLMEKAYAKAHGDYASLTGGWMGEGLEDLTGGVTTELLMSDIMDTDSFWADELSRVNDEFLFGCTTGLLDGGYGSRGGIAVGHAYNIVEARTLRNGTRLIKLRNPWGKVKAGTWEGAWSDGSKEWTTSIKEEVGHTFGSDSTFWIAYDDFMHKFQNIDRTRLFRDPDWRCCQRWIGVDVPWKTSYNEKFHIKLTVESPLVLVLSQLDARYFHGLDGQYVFRLHFRLHETGRPDAEDYIVRSHGNYLMGRSVSVELPAMEPGNYSVFLSVVGERYPSAQSVEDVVKEQLKDRVENEKLAQVGQAYDLAHSKAAAHLEELAKLRKKADQSKASDERKKERHKDWAKRHLLNDIHKRQKKKNDAKHERRKAERAEAKKKEEVEEAKKEEEKKEEEKKAEEEKEKEKKEKEKKEKKKAEEKEKNEKESAEKDVTKADDKTDDKSEEKIKKAEDKTEGKAEEKVEEVKEKVDGKTEVKTDDKTEAGNEKTESRPLTPDCETQAVTASSSGSSTPQKTPPESPASEAAEGSEAVSELAPAQVEEAEAASKASETAVKASSETAAATMSGEAKEAATTSDTPDKVGSDKEIATASEPKEAAPSSDVKEGAADEKDAEDESKEGATEGKAESKEEKGATGKDDEIGDNVSDGSTSDGACSDRKCKCAKKRASPSPFLPPPPPPPPPLEPEIDDSSDSPIEDYEEWYSSDDLTTRASRNAAKATGKTQAAEDESDDEKDPAPWNAICVVGIRVYSKDENLELRVVLEGGDLSEGGMGERGEQDLDNAQVNAGGQRVRKDAFTDREDAETDREERLKKKKTISDKSKLDQVETEAEAEAEAATTVETKGDKPDKASDDDKKLSDEADTNDAAEVADKAGEAEDAKTEATEKEGEADKATEKSDPPATDDGLATYTTIVQKDDEEYEKAVKTERLPAILAVDNTMMWG